MPSALAPNGIGTLLDVDGPSDPAEILGAAYQPIPDRNQSATIIEFWFSATAIPDSEPAELVFECFTAGADDNGNLVADVQIGDTLALTIDSPADPDPAVTRHAKLMFVDTRPQQSGTYVVTGFISGGAIADPGWYAQSVALTAVAP